MDRLPKDVIAIVDRCLFDYKYAQVKRQYRCVWLNDFENLDNKIYWDDEDVEFATNHRHVANWRTVPLIDRTGHSVGRFYEYRPANIGLPNNY